MGKRGHYKKEPIKLMECNKTVTYDGETMVRVLQELEMIVTSFDRMGSWAGISKNQREYEKESCRFIDESWIAPRLSSIRSVLCLAFDSELGDDDMDDLERAVENVPMWYKPGDVIRDRWLDWDEEYKKWKEKTGYREKTYRLDPETKEWVLVEEDEQ